MDQTEDKVAVIGAGGAIGRALVDALTEQGRKPVAIGRDAGRLERLFGGRAEVRAADLARPEELVTALEGTAVAVYAVGVPLREFDRHPELMRNAVAAAQRAGVRRMAVISSVYAYGRPRTAKVAETHPHEPHTRKGRFRLLQEEVALGAHGREGLETLVLHLPDFYGPYAANSLAFIMLEQAMAGKPVNWLGDPDAPHEFVYVPDAGRLIAVLVDRPDVWGRCWNLAGPGPISGRQFCALAARLLDRPVKVRAVGRWMLRLGGLFNPMLRELVELQYLGETPVLLDDAALAERLGPIEKTPYEEGIARMLDWMRRPSAGSGGTGDPAGAPERR